MDVAIKEAPARKVRARTKRKAAKIAQQSRPEFAGLTASDCCQDCCQERCVITQKPLCGHPYKGGLQPPDMAVSATVARFQRALKALKHAKIDLSEGY